MSAADTLRTLHASAIDELCATYPAQECNRRGHARFRKSAKLGRARVTMRIVGVGKLQAGSEVLFTESRKGVSAWHPSFGAATVLFDAKNIVEVQP